VLEEGNDLGVVLFHDPEHFLEAVQLRHDRLDETTVVRDEMRCEPTGRPLALDAERSRRRFVRLLADCANGLEKPDARNRAGNFAVILLVLLLDEIWEH